MLTVMACGPGLRVQGGPASQAAPKSSVQRLNSLEHALAPPAICTRRSGAASACDTPVLRSAGSQPPVPPPPPPGPSDALFSAWSSSARGDGLPQAPLSQVRACRVTPGVIRPSPKAASPGLVPFLNVQATQGKRCFHHMCVSCCACGSRRVRWTVCSGCHLQLCHRSGPSASAVASACLQASVSPVYPGFRQASSKQCVQLCAVGDSSQGQALLAVLCFKRALRPTALLAYVTAVSSMQEKCAGVCVAEFASGASVQPGLRRGAQEPRVVVGVWPLALFL